MPSVPHEALVEVLRENPALVLELLVRAEGVELPEHDRIVCERADLGSALPVELRADLAFRVDRAGSPVLVLVVEVQLAIDSEKTFSWPSYAVALRARHRCPVLLVVITVDRAVARWARRPIAFGPGAGYLRPLVLGPDELPAITDPAVAAASPELATISALAHGRDADVQRAVRIATTAAGAVLRLPDRRAAVYYDLIRAALGAAARKAFEMFAQDYIFQDEGMRRAHAEGETKGKAEGRAEAVLVVLEARGLHATEEVRARILACTDAAVLDRWLRAAVTVGDAAELFEL